MISVPELPIVFLSIKSFSALVEKIMGINHSLDLGERDRISFFERLIFSSAKVYLDIESEEIKELNFLQENSLSEIISRYDLNPGVGPYIRRLLSSGIKVDTCKSEMQQLVASDFSGMQEVNRQPVYIFLAKDAQFCAQLEKRSGVIIVSESFAFPTENIFVKADFIKARSPVDFVSILRSTPSFDWLIISDPYFFDKRNLTGELILQILKVLLSSNREIKLYVFFSDNEGINRGKVAAKIAARYPLLDIHLIPFSHGFIPHDRNIFSNTFWISCDYGFKAQYRDGTKWIRFPLAVYYPVYRDTLRNVLNLIWK